MNYDGSKVRNTVIGPVCVTLHCRVAQVNHSSKTLSILRERIYQHRTNLVNFANVSGYDRLAQPEVHKRQLSRTQSAHK